MFRRGIELLILSFDYFKFLFMFADFYKFFLKYVTFTSIILNEEWTLEKKVPKKVLFFLNAPPRLMARPLREEFP